ncbi:MAG TPA: tetratricopeptide repeat protein [Archangium sp.]|uniref:tetratricopeptide repeat protein n=1 Tax=Archangium sp. TaxID=1872627 RepID=UPI002E30EC62|nr:tetratricopeptide repeat protein [Archangium sp.]HEX5747415.1 tetratricopeptide repeat protein [Archangium sp.]
MPDEGNARPGEGTPSAVPAPETEAQGPSGGPPSAPEKGPPTLKELFHHGLYRRFGTWGLVTLALVSLGFFVQWNWDKVSTLPLLSQLVELLSREKSPPASARKFTVAVAHLENDEGQEYERLIRDTLNGYAGIEVIQVDREVMSKHAVSGERLEAGHARARKYLEKTGADMLIWGTVLQVGGQSTSKLFLTDSLGLNRKHSGRYAPENLSLPSLFWDELEQVLRLRVLTQSADLQAVQGRFAAEKLKPLVEKVRHLLESSEGQGWSVETRASMRVLLADALLRMGTYAGEGQELVAAVAAYRAALAERPRDREPLAWARTQNNLGLVLATLGSKERSRARLEEAVGAFRAALEERTRERGPLEWAQAQNNLALALTTLGKTGEGGAARLEEAVVAHRAALEALPRKREPLYWARIQNELGMTLRLLGERQGSTARLEEAVVAYRATLEEWTQELDPVAWAATQHRLAQTLRLLGEREQGTERLEEAVAVYRTVLRENARERQPLAWSHTQNHLGITLAILGERKQSAALLEEAVEAFQTSLDELKREREPLDWARTHFNLGNTLWMLGESKQSASLRCEALHSHGLAWEVFSGVGAPEAMVSEREVRRERDLLRSQPGSQGLERCLKTYGKRMARRLATLERRGSHHAR